MRTFILLIALGATLQSNSAAQRSMLPPGGSPGLPQEGTGNLYVTSTESPGTLYDLCNLSSLIVVGVVQSTLFSRQPSPQTIETDSVVTVVQTLKGTAPGTNIAVSQAGGTIGKVSLKPMQYALMQTGERYILFLNEDKRPQLPAITGLSRFQVTGVSAGLFYLNQGTLRLNAPQPHGFQMNYVGLSESAVINAITGVMKNGRPFVPPFVPTPKP